MAEVVLQDVNKIYPGGVRAVSGFDLTIADGEFVVLVGPSGCGKSTTLRMIAGLEDVTEGTIAIGGQVVNDVAPKDRDIAMVFQNYALYPHMTVYENMAFGLKLRRMPKPEIEKRVTQAAEMLGLAGVLKRRPAALSGGQRQRVAVGRAVVREPAVFLFDEPLSNLDAKLRGQMRAEISRLHQRLNTTMVYVTHDQVEAMTMGDRLVLMKDGAVQQVADPGTLYRAPANRFVAGFIGSPPMNFIPGRLRWSAGEDGGCRFSAAGDVELALDGWAQGAALRHGARGSEREVILGIRPEDIGSLRAEQHADAPRLRGVIDLLEPLGAETYVHVRIGETTCVSRAEGTRQLSVGQTVELAVYLDHLHLFDAQSGLPVAP